jgi:hypothetical protein
MTSSPDIDPSRLFEPDPEVIVTELEGKEAVLLHLGSRKYFSLNSTGLEIWQGLTEGLPLGEIARRLQNDYDLDADRATASVNRLAGELLAAGLVRTPDRP